MYSIILLLYQLLVIYLSYSTILSFVNILKPSPTIDTTTLWRKQYLPGANIHGNLSLSHIRTLNVATPSYVQILEEGILSVTSFSLLRKGSIMQFNLNNITNYRTLTGNYLWPNELTLFKHQKSNNNILLIPDGFLMPGQSDGGLFAIFNPNTPNECLPIRITTEKKGWFYHRAVYVRLPCGKEGIITARAHKPIIGHGQGELVWINIPNELTNYTSNNYYNKFSRLSNHSPMLEYDLPNNPWDEVILAKGPDVMFEITNTDNNDKTIDIVAAHFFNEKISIHTIKSTTTYPFVEVIRTTTIDTIGRPYGLCLASFSEPVSDDNTIDDEIIITKNKKRYRNNYLSTRQSNTRLYDRSIDNPIKPKEQTIQTKKSTHLLVSTHECSYDIPSAIHMAFSAIHGDYPRVNSGENRGFRDGENLPVENGYNSQSSRKGGSLFAYEIPQNKSNNNEWIRHTLFRGFKVRGWGGIFSPGAPGFPYVIQHPNQPKGSPLIILAGDCTGSAYIFSPINKNNCNKQSDIPEYELAFEVECGATVGSVAVSENSEGSLDLFVPSYELNKVHVFRLRNNLRLKNKKYNR